EHLQNYEPDALSNAVVLARRNHTARPHEAGDVTAMTVIVIRRRVDGRRRTGEVVELDDPAGEISVVLEARIEHRDADGRAHPVVAQAQARQETADDCVRGQ